MRLGLQASTRSSTSVTLSGPALLGTEKASASTWSSSFSRNDDESPAGVATPSSCRVTLVAVPSRSRRVVCASNATVPMPVSRSPSAPSGRRTRRLVPTRKYSVTSPVALTIRSWLLDGTSTHHAERTSLAMRASTTSCLSTESVSSCATVRAKLPLMVAVAVTSTAPSAAASSSSMSVNPQRAAWRGSRRGRRRAVGRACGFVCGCT
jgi:hypothetical protein